MKAQFRHYTSALTFLILGTATFAIADENPTRQLEVESGTASFESVTNIPGIDVKGKSNALTAHVDLTTAPGGFTLEKIDASVPVKSLATGMKVRDEHMRKYIFTTADGQTPDLRFEAGPVECPAAAGARDFTCKVSGMMTIRGTAHPLSLTLQAKQQSGSTLAFRVAGEGVVKLSDFGITAPSQFGVTPSNDVKVRLEFAARQKTAVSSNAGAR